MKILSARYSFTHNYGVGGVASFRGIVHDKSWVSISVPDSSRKTIVVGYVFATLGGLIGIIKRVDIMKKENVEDKFHGKVITAIGIVTIIIVMISAGLLFYFKKCSR